MSGNAHLIVDAGATKSNFVVVENNEIVCHVLEKGINATYSEVSEIMQIISSAVANFPKELTIIEVDFYGAGCAREENASKINSLLQLFFPKSSINVHSDLLAACRALSGKDSSIVCILGTGAASCYYDGEKIAKRAPSLGYLLGDEGSGTNLGKRFLISYLNHSLPIEIKSDFENKFSISEEITIRKIYQEPHPNNFMSSIPPFLHENIKEDVISDLVIDAFRDFFKSQNPHYLLEDSKIWNFTGSVAEYFKTQLYAAAKAENCIIGKIVANPMSLLLKYHHDEIEIYDKY